ncbi:MAG: porin [bacterium]
MTQKAQVRSEIIGLGRSPSPSRRRVAPSWRLVAAVVSIQVLAWSPAIHAGDPPVETDTELQAAPEMDEGSPDSSGAKPKKPKPKISGYIQFYYRTRIERSGDNITSPDAFRFGRVKIRFTGKAQPGVTYVVEVDPRSPQISGVMRDCYIQWEFVDGQRLRFGQMKTPFGWENRVSTTDLYTINRTEVSELFGRGLTLRDIGVGCFGRIPLGNGFRIEDEITITNGAGLGAQADDDKRKNVFARLGARKKAESATLWLGVSGATGTVNEPSDPETPDEPGLSFDFQRFGVDVGVDTRHAFAVVEYAYGDEKANDPEEGGALAAWYLLVAGKTSFGVGPVVRYDVFDEDITRWTVGGYYGLPGAALRSIVTYEVSKEAEFDNDDRLLAMLQLLF